MSSERKRHAEKNCVNLIEDTEENEAANREKRVQKLQPMAGTDADIAACFLKPWRNMTGITAMCTGNH